MKNCISDVPQCLNCDFVDSMFCRYHSDGLDVPLYEQVPNDYFFDSSFNDDDLPF